MSVRPIRADEYGEVLLMVRALWPDAGAYDFSDETVFVWERERGGLGGFISISLRPWAEGCDSTPVPYIEGWWVAPDLRGSGVGRALVQAVEQWCIAHGHAELGSDVEVENDVSLRAHAALGFEPTLRLQFYRKRLRRPEQGTEDGGRGSEGRGGRSAAYLDDVNDHARIAELISSLGLGAHPEGGYFAEVHRSRMEVHPADGRPSRSASTAIYFLLAAGDVSRWHRVASDEVWHFYEGAPLQLLQAHDAFDGVDVRILGPYGGDARPIRVVPAGVWQAAKSTGAYSLVGCTVGPGFDFADFELLGRNEDAASIVKQKQPDYAAFV